MQVTFEISLEDIHAFNAHYALSSALPQRSRALVRGALTLTLSSLLLALGLAIRAPLPFWLVGGLILLGWWQFYPRRVEAMTRRATQRLYGEGRNLGMLGPHTVTIDLEWLTESSADREVRTRWRAIEKVAATAEHLFVYVSGFSAVIVPTRAFATPEALATFRAELDRLVGSHR